MDHSSVKPEIVMGNNINRHNNMNNSSVKHQTVMVNNIANHSNMKYCYHTPKTANGQQYGPLLCQTLNSNGQHYNLPQQYEPLLYQT
jgi:hypothetical protein